MESSPWYKKLFLEESVLTRVAVRCLAGPGPIAMLMLVRDEKDIIRESMEFHLRFGIENFVVTDNGSVDGTRDILSDLKRELGKGLVIIDDAEPAHRQIDRVKRMIEVSKRTFRPRWIISSDADEFWYPVNGNYHSEFDRRKNILSCFWHNFLPRADTAWQQFTQIGEMPGYHGRMQKSLCLARGLLGMYSGNHAARQIPHIEATSTNIRIYHYPIRTYEQFERKVVQGHRATVKASMHQNVNWHWREYYKAWEEQRLPDVYRQLASQDLATEDTTMAEHFRVEAPLRPAMGV